MLEEYKQPWIKALRSGEYKQGTDLLINDDEYCCCLGVLCSIINIQYNETQDESSFTRAGLPTYPKLLEKVGLLFDDEVILIDMNDNQNKSFSEIADYIEANF